MPTIARWEGAAIGLWRWALTARRRTGSARSRSPSLTSGSSTASTKATMGSCTASRAAGLPRRQPATRPSRAARAKQAAARGRRPLASSSWGSVGISGVTIAGTQRGARASTRASRPASSSSSRQASQAPRWAARAISRPAAGVAGSQ